MELHDWDLRATMVAMICRSSMASFQGETEKSEIARFLGHDSFCNKSKISLPTIKGGRTRHGICQKIYTAGISAKTFTPSISANFNSFGDKNTKKLVKMEKFTPLAKILHCRQQ